MVKNITQKVYNYTAVFEPTKEGGFNVYFPALPGCVTFGKNIREAKRMAKEVLELWLKELAGAKERMPVEKRRPVIDRIQVSIPVR